MLSTTDQKERSQKKLNTIRTEYSEEFLEYRKKFITYIQELRQKAKELNLPLSISPTIDGIKMFDTNGEVNTNVTQLSILCDMIREAKMYEPDYL